MKEYMVKINKRTGYACFWTTIRLLLLISLIFSFASFDLGYADTSKKYYLMSIEEASQLVENIIKEKKVPSPGYFSSWKLPETKLISQGIKINDNDYIVFAYAKIETLIELPSTDVPQEIEEMPMGFVLNEILFTTIDFEVVNRPVYKHLGGGKWVKISQTIEKGGYLWYVGRGGMYLSAGIWELDNKLRVTQWGQVYLLDIVSGI